MVTHANLADNLQCIIAKCRVGRQSRCLTWLPHFHDMGLIGGLLTPMYAGATCHFMTPMDFAKHPLSWLKAASCWRSTYTGAPNFAYEACASLAEDNPELELDLRSLESCACGAEPISASSIRRFFFAYARYGLRPASFFPCYGMSECTVMACSAGVGESGLDLLQTFDRPDMDVGHAAALHGAGGGMELVSSGTPVAGHDVIVVDPSCQPCPDGVTGEIWIAGPSVAAGYWNDPGQTAASFGARTSEGEGPYLRSGDLGFFHDGRLFVTGRSKDLIIIRGRKHYPQDIEYPVGRCHPQLRPGISAAFSIVSDAGVEGMALVQAVKPARDPMLYAVIAQQIRALILQQHGVALDALILTRARDVPQTTSGKVQRQLCRARYLSGELHPLYQMDWPS
jgi:acyl-CoA synthetase (AMP-forming)/AMP-acid ligase II